MKAIRYCCPALFLGAIFFAAFGVLVCPAADWPHFLGPNYNNTSAETGLARSWPAEGPKVLWTVKVGQGFGPPAVRDGKVYLLDREDKKLDVLHCLNFDTGAELWRIAHPAPEGKLAKYHGSRSTPTVDDKYIYSIGTYGQFYCDDPATQKPVWQKDILKEFKRELPRWALSQSPLVYKNLVIVAPVGPEVGVVAFDKISGETVWSSGPIGDAMGHASPVIATIGGVEQVLMTSNGFTAEAGVYGIDPTSGKILWFYYRECNRNVPGPVVVDDKRLFISAGYGVGSQMIKVEQAGGKWAVTELWKTMKCGAQIHQALLFENHLYVNSNSNERTDGLMCMDLDGNVRWKTVDEGRQPTFNRGGLILADGLIYMVEGEKGVLYLIEPNSSEFKMLASAPMLSGKLIWTPPVLANGRLIIRDQAQLKCLDVKAP